MQNMFSTKPQTRGAISRASLILGAFSQHLFGGALQRVRDMNVAHGGRHAAPKAQKHNPAGSKPAGTRGMHHAEFSMPFRPMAHGKLGKKSGQGKRTQRMRRRGYAAALDLKLFKDVRIAL